MKTSTASLERFAHRRRWVTAGMLALLAVGLVTAQPADAAVLAGMVPPAGVVPPARVAKAVPLARGVPLARIDDPAGRSRTLDRRLAELRESLEGTADDLVDAAVDLRRAQSDRADANAALEQAHAALEAANERDEMLAGRLAVAEAGLGKAEADLTARRRQEAGTRSLLGGIARQAYLSQGVSTFSGLAIALDAVSPEQFTDEVNVAGTALRYQNGALARLQVQQAETTARRARLAAAQDQLASLKRESEAVVGQRREAQRTAAQAAATIKRLVAVRTHAVHLIRARRAAERARVAKLQKEQNQLAKLLRSRSHHSSSSGSGGSGGGDDGGSGLSYPVDAPITSGFGWRYHPILHYSRLHAGTDFGAACGTPVRAAAAGTVVRAGWAGGFGNQVVLDHGRMRGKNLASSYNHLSRIVVHHGSVRRGEVIAYSGTTGLSTGCHLHFEVYVNGTHVNPVGWL